VVCDHVYVAVRDADANNLPGTTRDLVVTEGPGPRFEARFVCRHAVGGGWYEWNGRVVGNPDGRIEYHMAGVASSAFVYPRLGLCVLHSADRYAGARYESRLGSATTTGVLPVSIGPQRYERGRLHGLLAPFGRLELQPDDGTAIVFEFEGDLFQMEDQRSFGDSTFKTYSTPIEWVGPYRLEAGQELAQSVAISVRHDQSAAASVRPLKVGIVRLGAATGRSAPPIGLNTASDDVEPSAAELDRVASLKPSHIRAEVVVAHGLAAAERTMVRASAEASSAGCALWVDLIVDTDRRSDFEAIVAMIASRERTPEYVFVATRVLEPPDSGEGRERLLATRRAFADRSRPTTVGIAAQRRLAEINRWEYDGGFVQALSFPFSPTAHLADDMTMVSNLGQLGDMVASARGSMGDRPVYVGPISLTTRRGPYPLGPDGLAGLPARVDQRQVSLLAAAWTVGCVSHLVHGGASGLTLYETLGWLGVSERDAGSMAQGSFHSRAGSVFPVWHVVADLCEWTGGQVVSHQTIDGGGLGPRIAAYAVDDGSGTHMLIASLVDRAQDVRVEGITGRKYRLRVLDETTALGAMMDPAAFRRRTEEHMPDGGSLDLRLDPYATARLDLA